MKTQPVVGRIDVRSAPIGESAALFRNAKTVWRERCDNRKTSLRLGEEIDEIELLAQLDHAHACNIRDFRSTAPSTEGEG